ncbi:uncharacterized protein EDB91DRAFT_1125725, partial [Suillus paluster]|uniref:uncharacterized protein n=1 Tax=Suillus paluster TaxID=48578 RepID=UPI001B85D4B4
MRTSFQWSCPYCWLCPSFSRQPIATGACGPSCPTMPQEDLPANVPGDSMQPGKCFCTSGLRNRRWLVAATRPRLTTIQVSSFLTSLHLLTLASSCIHAQIFFVTYCVVCRLILPSIHHTDADHDTLDNSLSWYQLHQYRISRLGSSARCRLLSFSAVCMYALRNTLDPIYYLA